MEACEENWEKNGEHCYLWNTDAMNWTAAEDFCQQAGGHLASVPSSSTNDYIWEGANRTSLDLTWLGGNDILEEGVWKWLDCTPWEYTFWYPGEPNNGGGAEDCLHAYGTGNIWDREPRTWNDVPCGRELGFVCNKKICSGRINEHLKK